MHVSKGLGFSSLVLLLLFLVFPCLAFVIQRKWRRSVARKEEIERLIVLASEEAARAELEASVGYGAVVSIARISYQCAVCYCPTTTRCARCKAVRYCSGKCQIIHWRQGHKEDCHPPNTTYYPSDDQRCSIENAMGIAQHETNDKLVLDCPSSMPKASPAKDENVTVSSIAVAEDEVSSSEASGNSFSGFSSSPDSGETPIDGCAAESISSNEIEGPDAQVSAAISLEMLDSTLNKMGESNSFSPKFATLVDSLGNVNKLGESNLSKRCNHDGETQDASTSSPYHVSAMCEVSVMKTDEVSSGSLEPAISSCDAVDGSILSNSSAAGNSNYSDGESLQHPKQSAKVVTPLHAKGPESKGMTEDSHPDFLVTSQPVCMGVSETACVDVQKSPSSLSSVPGKSNQVDNDSTANSNGAKSNGPKSLSTSSSVADPSSEAGKNALDVDVRVSISPCSFAGRLNHVVDAPIIVPRTSNSSLASNVSPQSHLVSNASGHSAPNMKIEKLSVETVSVASTQMANPSALSSISGLKSSVRKVVDQFKGPRKCKVGSNIALCDNSSGGLFPYDLFAKVYTSNKVVMQPCGLINCGNSCYLNVVLQCLAFTPPLAAYFLQGLHSKSCVNKEKCFTCEFETLILKAKEGKSSLSTIGIISQLENIGSQHGQGREEDAHEFLRYAIDIMQSVCLKEAEVSVGSFEEETTLIGLTFGGYLRSKIKCTKCQYKSERQERMMDLTVEIEGDVGKLEDALRRFTSTEILDGDNKYLCSRCKSYEKGKKKLTILEAPNILTIALKRFQSGKFGKLNKSIRFPEILDLTPYMSGTNDKSPIYRLFAVVVHLDTMNATFSGHYVCYVKNVQNKWFKVDDSMVTPVELDKVLSQGAYMLLYARCVPRAPKFIRYHIISPDPKNKGGPTKIDLKSSVLNSRTTSTRSRVVSLQPNPIPPDNMSSVESFYLKFHQLQKILEEDSSSDTYSFTSSNSDEGSCSTDTTSTRDSTSAEELSDYIFGSWNSPWRNTSNTDASSSSSSSSTLYLRRSTSVSETDYVCSTADDDDAWDKLFSRSHKLVDLDGKEAYPFFHSDTNKHCRKVVNSSCRENDIEKVGMG